MIKMKESKKTKVNLEANVSKKKKKKKMRSMRKNIRGRNGKKLILILEELDDPIELM